LPPDSPPVAATSVGLASFELARESIFAFYARDHLAILNTDAGTMGANCIFEDKPGKEVGETLAHETGHFLGAADTDAVAQKPLLMYGITDHRGRRLTKADVNLMNP
jgi:hypothetical protein